LLRVNGQYSFYLKAAQGMKVKVGSHDMQNYERCRGNIVNKTTEIRSVILKVQTTTAVKNNRISQAQYLKDSTQTYQNVRQCGWRQINALSYFALS
jgi:hypothetical protein